MKRSRRSQPSCPPQVVRRRSALAIGIASCLCSPAFAVDSQSTDETWVRLIDALNPYASLAYTYDSNIFRLDDAAPGTPDRSDQYATFSAGFDSNIDVSQQRYELAGVVNHTLYNTYDELDYTGGKLNAIWHWSAGSEWTGDLGYRYRRTLRDFANQIGFDRTQDIRSEHQVLGSANFDFPGNWKAGLRADLADISYSDSKQLDLQRTTFGGDVMYVSSAGNEVGLDGRMIQGDYQSQSVSDFDEYTVGPKIQWQLSARTKLDGRIGYTSRDYVDPARTDYDDVTGRVAVTLADNGLNQVTAAVYRDLSNLGDEIADFAVIDGVSIEPQWRVSEAVTLRVTASYEQRDFKVRELAGEDRKDDVYGAGAFVDWDIGRNIRLSFGVDTQQRSSTRELQDYDANRVQLQIVGRL